MQSPLTQAAQPASNVDTYNGKRRVAAAVAPCMAFNGRRLLILQMYVQQHSEQIDRDGARVREREGGRKEERRRAYKYVLALGLGPGFGLSLLSERILILSPNTLGP